MLVTAGTVALILIVLGELLRALLHFSIGSLSIAGGVILLVLAVWMVLAPPGGGADHSTAEKDPMQLARFPLAVPYLLNPVGIVGLVTISAEATSLAVLAVAIAILLVGLTDRCCGLPLGKPGQCQARRKPHAGHREGVWLPHCRHRRATHPRRPGLGRGDRTCQALSRRPSHAGLSSVWRHAKRETACQGSAYCRAAAIPISSGSALGRQRPTADGVILIILAVWMVLQSRHYRPAFSFVVELGILVFVMHGMQ